MCSADSARRFRWRSRFRRPRFGSYRIVSSNSKFRGRACRTAALVSTSACSAAASEPQVMPPPVPYTAFRVTVSTTAVRIATLKRARTGVSGGPTSPMAPQ